MAMLKLFGQSCGLLTKTYQIYRCETYRVDKVELWLFLILCFIFECLYS